MADNNGNTHVVKVKLTLTFDEMDGTAQQSAEMAMEFLYEWSQGYAFTMDARVTDYYNATRLLNTKFQLENAGKPCAECGDNMVLCHSNLAPTWSDFHDNVVCYDCFQVAYYNSNEPTEDLA